MVLIAGIDEAARGPIVGDMFLAGAAIDEDKLYLLTGMGLKDSKLLTPKRREELCEELKKLVQ